MHWTAELGDSGRRHLRTASVLVVLLLALFATGIPVVGAGAEVPGEDGGGRAAAAAAARASIDPGAFAEVYEATAWGLDYTASGVGLRGASSGTIAVAGIPTDAEIYRAMLFWAVVIPDDYDPDLFARAKLGGRDVSAEGSSITRAPGPCWDRTEWAYSYRTDVTSLVQRDGPYEVELPHAGPPEPTNEHGEAVMPPLLEGASLVVVFQDPSIAERRTVVVAGGAQTVTNATTVASSKVELPPVASDHPFARTTFILADGQDHYDDSIAVNGAVLAADTASTSWAADGSDGKLWDTDTYPVTHLFPAGSTSGRFEVRYAGDCVTHVAQVLAAHTAAEDPVQKKVQVVVLDPVLRTEGGIRLSQYLGVTNPTEIVDPMRSHLHDLSFEFVDYQVASMPAPMNRFPPQNPTEPGKRALTERSYLDCVHAEWSQDPARVDQTCGKLPNSFDYKTALGSTGRGYDSCEMRNRGQIDEVWFVGPGWFGLAESALAGRNAFRINGPALTDTECAGLLPVMFFHYQRGVGEALESYGHRVEATMEKVYTDATGVAWSVDERTPWNTFTLRNAPGAVARCGCTHFPPNSAHGATCPNQGANYDWDATAVIASACDDWYDYPNLPLEPRTKLVDCHTWAEPTDPPRCVSDNGYRFKKWWFKHLPVGVGETDGVANNWWKYIVDYEHTPHRIR